MSTGDPEDGVTRYRWGFELINVNSVEGLSWGMPGPDAAILREEEDAMPAVLFFASQHFNDLDDPGDVVARGQALKMLFDGALYLDCGPSHRPEPLRDLWEFKTERRLGFPAPSSGVGPFSSTFCQRKIAESQSTRVLNGLLEGALFCARTDATVQGMLATLGRDGVQWRTLYALTDTMKTNGMAPEQQWTMASSSKAEWELFKRTANNFAAIGLDARHGELSHQPPSKPMTLDRAAELVLAAARSFVRKRIDRATAVLAAEKAARDAERASVLAAARARKQ